MARVLPVPASDVNAGPNTFEGSSPHRARIPGGTARAQTSHMSRAATAPIDILLSVLRRDPDGRYAMPKGAEVRLDRGWAPLAKRSDAKAGFARVLKLVVALEKKFDAAAIADRILDVLKNNPATLKILKSLRAAFRQHLPRGLERLGRRTVKAAPRFGQAAPKGSSKVSDLFDVGMQPPPGVTARVRRPVAPRPEAPARKPVPARRAFSVG